jgi:hypothetical protein
MHPPSDKHVCSEYEWPPSFLIWYTATKHTIKVLYKDLKGQMHLPSDKHMGKGSVSVFVLVADQTHKKVAIHIQRSQDRDLAH